MFTRRGWAYRQRDRGFRATMRFFFPHIAGEIRREHEDGTFAAADGAAPPHKLVIDRGSDTTIVSFSSAALLHAGQPTKEFEGFFRRYGRDYNLVFFRDVHRSAYHFTPEGKAGGTAFYEKDLRDTLAALGSTRHIAIGDSAGAAAAIYYGARCGFDQIIAFSPPFPLRHWVSPLAQVRALFDLGLLFREPSAYSEHVVLSFTPIFWLLLPIGFRCGFRNIWDPIATYAASGHPPKLTVFFGEGSRPERRILAPLRGLPDVELRPLATAKHFAMVQLARRGQLAETIMVIVDRSTPAS
jgi:hypothetical protein